MNYFNITLVVLIAILTALSYFKGKRLLFALIVSFYPAAALYIAFPYKDNFIFMKDNAMQVFYSHMAIFAVFFVIIGFATYRITHADGIHSGLAGFFEALALSASITLLIIALSFHVLPYRDIFGLSSDVQNFFISGLGYFVSVLVPIGVIAWFTRRY